MADEKVLYEVKDKIALDHAQSARVVERGEPRHGESGCWILPRGGRGSNGAGRDIQGQRRAGIFRWRRYQDRARQNATAVEQAESPLVQRQAKHSGIPGTPAPAIAAMNKITIALLHGYTVGTGLLMSLPAISASRQKAHDLGSVKCGLVSWRVRVERNACRGWSAFQRHWRFAFPANFTTPRSVIASAW